MPLSTAQLLRRAEHAGTQIGKLCQWIYHQQGERGIRRSEARGARWEDYDGKTLSVRQSIWRKHTTDTKCGPVSAKPVLIIEPLRELLAELREAKGNPANGPILRGVKGKPLNLDMLAKCVIRPALRNLENYRDLKAKPIEWQGFYSLRRGIATQLTAITRDPMAAKGLLRHSSVNTTLAHYINDVQRSPRTEWRKLNSYSASSMNE